MIDDGEDTPEPGKPMASGGVSRREVLRGLGVALSAVPMPAAVTQAQRPAAPAAAAEAVTQPLARYMAGARDRALPSAVVQDAKHRILDTVGAIVSGARLKPGEMAIRYVAAQGGVPEASVFTTGMRTSAVNAALANGMFAHADETDDFEPVTKAHPGCAVVPAAFAMAEREDRGGTDLLRAVVLGYDVCCRFLLALGPDLVRASHRSAEGVSSTFGAVAAAASLAGLDETQMRYALSYAAQQVSGLWSWERDVEHVEKAFDFSGMGSRNGVTAAVMAQLGFTGVPDVLDGEHNLLEAMSTAPRPAQMIDRLGTRFFVSESAIKVFSVGYPLQAALDAFFTLQREHRFTADAVDRIVVRLPADGARIVDDRAMPDVNCQYVIAVALLDGALSFDDSHSYERMRDPRVLAAKQRVQLIADRALVDPAAPRSARVEVTLRGGRTVSHFTRFPPGTKESPLPTARVNEKAQGLMAPVLGRERTERLIARLNDLERVRSVRDLRPLVTSSP